MSVPAGTYGTFTVNGSGSLVLGVAGATTAAVYNLQGLVVNGGATVTIVGPVVINLGRRPCNANGRSARPPIPSGWPSTSPPAASR